MSRLAIALVALFVLVFTGGLNPAPQHEGLLLISLTLLMYMAAFSVTKKNESCNRLSRFENTAPAAFCGS